MESITTIVLTDFLDFVPVFLWLAATEMHKPNKNLIKIKKKHVYAARLLELHKGTQQTGNTKNIDLLLENAWRGAESYHYLILAHQQLYSGKIHHALCIFYKLQDYTDFISEVEIYSLLSLTACLDRSFSICSKAFMKLKTLKNEVNASDQHKYSKLAWDIFRQNEPTNFKKKQIKCDNCEVNMPDWNTACPNCKIHFPTCVATGLSIVGAPTWSCKVCRHPALQRKMDLLNCCPLCHAKHERQ